MLVVVKAKHNNHVLRPCFEELGNGVGILDLEELLPGPDGICLHELDLSVNKSTTHIVLRGRGQGWDEGLRSLSLHDGDPF